METQKIVNLLNSFENKYSKFATKNWYIIDSETSGVYSEKESIKFLTRSIESSLCDYSDTYILVTGNITPSGNYTKTTFKNCAPFNDNGEPSDLSADNSSSFNYKSNLTGVLPNDERKIGVKIVVPLKYLSNFWRSLEMLLINCKIELSLTWSKIVHCLL